MERYFLGESGNGGDLASSTVLDFSGQPVFALSCVGIADEPAIMHRDPDRQAAEAR
jgi:hypothetical protein